MDLGKQKEKEDQAQEEDWHSGAVRVACWGDEMSFVFSQIFFCV